MAAINRTEKTVLFQKSQILQFKTEFVESSTRIFLDGPSNNFDMSSLLFLMVKRIFQTITIDSNTISDEYFKDPRSKRSRSLNWDIKL